MKGEQRENLIWRFTKKPVPFVRNPVRWGVNSKSHFCSSACQEATEKGFAFIGSESHGYSVSACSGQSKRGGRWRWGIFLKTPDREYVFMCEQESEQKEWIEAFRKIISQPMTPEDYASTLLLCQITFYHFVHVQAFTSRSFFYRWSQFEARKIIGMLWPCCTQQDTADVTKKAPS